MSEETCTAKFTIHENSNAKLINVKIEVPGEEPLFISANQLAAIHELFKRMGLVKKRV